MNFRLIIIVIIISLNFGCSITKKIAGADIDPVQFDKAREAKMLEIRYQSAASLLNRLNNNNKIESSEINIIISEELLNKILEQYHNSTGWLDEATNYKIVSSKLTIKYGVILVNFGLIANNKKYSANVKLNLDCIMVLKEQNNELIAELEPYNISPLVEINSIFSFANEIVENLIKINLANLSKTLPPLKIPIEFDNQFIINGSINNFKEKVNINLTNPERKIFFKLKIKEILFLENKALIAINLDKIEVK